MQASVSSSTVADWSSLIDFILLWFSLQQSSLFSPPLTHTQWDCDEVWDLEEWLCSLFCWATFQQSPLMSLLVLRQAATLLQSTSQESLFLFMKAFSLCASCPTLKQEHWYSHENPQNPVESWPLAIQYSIVCLLMIIQTKLFCDTRTCNMAKLIHPLHTLSIWLLMMKGKDNPSQTITHQTVCWWLFSQISNTSTVI